MATVLLNDQYLTATANAIRSKLGSSDTFTPAEFANAISGISGSGSGSSSGGGHIEVATAVGDGTTTISFSGISAMPDYYLCIQI